jgi:parallel beta helix pectate lyase-like protein
MTQNYPTSVSYRNKGEPPLFSRTMLLLMLLIGQSSVGAEDARLSVAEFLPAGYVRDGSVAYYDEIQQALDAADESGAMLVFPAMTYAASEQGWQLHSAMTLRMSGAIFQLSAQCDRDGAVFQATDVVDLTLVGGAIVGRNDRWGDGVNVRGVSITGESARIQISEMKFRDLSSNGIGVFGTADKTIHDVWIRDVIVENCCKRYPDYLSDEKPEPDSVREDQGDVAFYYVEDFTVRGCRFERSRSDGTHFYRCQRGQIIGNRIYRAKMGGFFLETCNEVIGQGNVMIENGSRGTTIERGSTDCVFSGNTVLSSGREGLWAPDCVGLLVSGNIFKYNGRKPNGPERRHRWNANITINESSHDPSKTTARDYMISANMITTGDSQIAALRVDTTDATRNIVIQANMLLGQNREILVEGPKQAEVHLSGNHGAQPVN